MLRGWVQTSSAFGGVSCTGIDSNKDSMRPCMAASTGSSSSPETGRDSRKPCEIHAAVAKQ